MIRRARLDGREARGNEERDKRDDCASTGANYFQEEVCCYKFEAN